MGLLCSRARGPRHVHSHLPRAPSAPRQQPLSPADGGLAEKAGQEQAGLLQAAPRAPQEPGTPLLSSAARQPKADHKGTSVRLQGSGTGEGHKASRSCVFANNPAEL